MAGAPHQPWETGFAFSLLFSENLKLITENLGLFRSPMSTDMLLQSPERQVPLDCPGPRQKANRRDGCTSEHENVRVPLGVSSRLVQEEYPGQEESGREENADITFCSHGCPAKSRFGYLVRSLAFVNNSNLTIPRRYDTDFTMRW
ncbi:MAG TPA: hypothetical protein VJY15_01720 [Candidatus Acidoferrum sp.]|nr:hypothetical protein [Candidatus Acidoferrum sp.]